MKKLIILVLSITAICGASIGKIFRPNVLPQAPKFAKFTPGSADEARWKMDMLSWESRLSGAMAQQYRDNLTLFQKFMDAGRAGGIEELNGSQAKFSNLHVMGLMVPNGDKVKEWKGERADRYCVMLTFHNPKSASDADIHSLKGAPKAVFVLLYWTKSMDEAKWFASKKGYGTDLDAEGSVSSIEYHEPDETGIESVILQLK